MLQTTSLSSDPFEGTWFLESTETIDERLVTTVWEPRVWKRDEIIDQLWLELLVLALCHPGLFNITSVVKSKPGWSCLEANVSNNLSNQDRDISEVLYASPGRESDDWGEW